jgi:glutathione S-transferase
MIKVYGYPATRSTRVTWALEEAGAKYEFIPVNLRAGEHKKLAFLSINPFGKVPALVEDNLILTESPAIGTYIAEKFPDANLIPPVSQPQARAQYFQWMFFSVSELETHLWTAAKHKNYLPEDKRVSAVVDTCIWEFEKASEILASHLQQQAFIAGENFTAADILCVAILNWAASEGIKLHDALAEYRLRISARPALARARKREADAAV